MKNKKKPLGLLLILLSTFGNGCATGPELAICSLKSDKDVGLCSDGSDKAIKEMQEKRYMCIHPDGFQYFVEWAKRNCSPVGLSL